MTQIKFDLEAAQIIINRLDEIKSSINNKTFEVSGRVSEIYEIRDLHILNDSLDEKCKFMNAQKGIMSSNIQCVIDKIRQAGNEFTSTNFNIIQGANRTEGELQ